jgi:AraC-like DNA-binding protein
MLAKLDLGCQNQYSLNYMLSTMLPEIKLNIFNLIMLLGAFQGFLLSGLLYLKNHRDRHANRFLIVLLLTFSIHLLHQVGFDTGFFNQLPFLHVIPYSYLYVIGPAVYLYARALLNPTYTFTPQKALHFLPSLYMLPLLALYYSVLKVGPKAYKMYFFTTIQVIENYIAPVLMLVYLVATYRMLYRYRRVFVAKQAELPMQLRWLLHVVSTLIVGMVVWKMYFLYHEHVRGESLALTDYYPLYFMLAILIYWLGFNGFLQSVPMQAIWKIVVAPVASQQQLVTLAVAHVDEPETKSTEDKLVQFQKMPPSDGLSRVGLSEEQADKVLVHLDEQMHTMRYYRQQNLTLESFGRQIGIAPRIISAVINTKRQQNFSDFINSYRIEDVIRRLKNKEHAHLTLIGIAFESGFNSKTSFNRAFKEVTGKTPKDYKSLV